MNWPLKYISFGIGLFLIVVSVCQSAKVIHFYLNQDEIAEKYCENKDKPELKCHGKCHLNKELKIDQQEEEKEIPNPPRTFLIWLLAFRDLPLSPLQDAVYVHHMYGYIDHLSQFEPHPANAPPENC